MCTGIGERKRIKEEMKKNTANMLQEVQSLLSDVMANENDRARNDCAAH